MHALDEDAPLAWREPPFWAIRCRDAKGWGMRGMIAAVGFVVGLALFQSDAQPARRQDLTETVLLACLFGLGLPVLLELPMLMREVTLFDDRIHAVNPELSLLYNRTWNFAELVSARLLTPEELGRAFAVIELQTTRKAHRLGVPASLPLQSIAQAFQDAGVPVVVARLPPELEAPRVRRGSDWVAPGKPTASARIDWVDAENTAAYTNAQIVLRDLIRYGPAFLLGLPGLGIVAVFLARLEFRDAESLLFNLGMLLAGVLLLSFGIGYFMRIGIPASNAYCEKIAGELIETRAERIVSPRDPDAVFVRVSNSPREQNPSGSFDDEGFFKIDHAARALCFEGLSQRWFLPLGSLVSFRVDALNTGPRVEGDPADIRVYQTIVSLNLDGEVREVSLTRGRTSLVVPNSAREAQAIELADQMASLWRGDQRPPSPKAPA